MPSSTSTSSIDATTSHGANPIVAHEAIDKSHAMCKLLISSNTSCQFHNEQCCKNMIKKNNNSDDNVNLLPRNIQCSKESRKESR